MVKKKVCKKCKIFVDGSKCPICSDNQFTTNWKGRVYILDANKSMVAKKLGITVKGEYAIKAK